MSAKWTPWFSARNQPPVDDDQYAAYELRCDFGVGMEIVPAQKFDVIKNGKHCPDCQWRGLTKPAQPAKGM